LLPDNIKNLLAEHNVEIGVGDRCREVVATLSGSPRGWPPGKTWDMVSACYSPVKNRVVLAMKPIHPWKNQVYSVSKNDVQHALYHESGHAFDTKIFSKNTNLLRESTRIYNQEAAAITRAADRDSPNLSYYLQPGAAGRSEAMAESLSAAWNPNHNNQKFSRLFPRLIAFVKENTK